MVTTNVKLMVPVLYSSCMTVRLLSAYAIYKINICKIKKLKKLENEQILFIVYKHSDYRVFLCWLLFVLCFIYLFTYLIIYVLSLFYLDEEGWGRDPPGHNIGDGKTPQKSDWE